MGMNVYLENVASYGYKACATAKATMQQNIPGISGQRIAIRAFGAVSGSQATALYFMQVAASTTTDGAAVSSATTVKLTSTAIGGAAATLAALDHVCFLMDNGTYHFTTVASMGVATVEVTDAFVDTVADNQPVWGFGVQSDTGHVGYQLTAHGAAPGTSTNKELEGGLFYGSGKGHPMIVKFLDLASTMVATLNYVTVGYINK